MYLRFFVIISTLKRAWFFIWTWIPFTKGIFVPSQVWLILALWCWRRMWKIMDRRTTGDQKSSLELSSQGELKWIQYNLKLVKAHFLINANSITICWECKFLSSHLIAKMYLNVNLYLSLCTIKALVWTCTVMRICRLFLW